MKPVQIYKTSINPAIFLHWLLLTIALGIVASHFSENPNGLSILIGILILPLIFNKIDRLIISDENLIIENWYGIRVFRTKEVINLNDIKKVDYVNVNRQVRDGNLGTSQNTDIFLGLFFGRWFYQETNFLTFLLKDDSEIIVSVNVPRNEIENVLELIQNKY